MAVETQTTSQKESKETVAAKARLGWVVNGSLLVPLWFLSLTAVAITLFSFGFLLTRPTLPNIARKSEIYSDPEINLPRPFKRAIVVVIDALREDFLTGTSDSFYSNALTTPLGLAVAEPDKAAIYKLIADPPTTTLQRLKALTTGSLPTFIDAGSNFNGQAISEDSWIQQLISRHGPNRIAFAGDNTWTSLFPSLLNGSKLETPIVFPFESFNVWDLDTVDTGVSQNLISLLEKRSEWDVLIAHYLGVDHAGHRYGPDTEPMRNKLLEMDIAVRNIVSALKDDDETVLFVLGDHGMDEKGDHGGDSKSEVEAGLFLYSSRPFLSPKHAISTINQIDIVPTLSILLDLPIPFNNLGSPIVRAMLGVDNNFKQLAYASRLVTEQINRYRLLHPSFVEAAEASMLYESANEIISTKDYKLISEINLAFHYENLRVCRAKWARFDLMSMSFGIGIFATAVICMIIFYGSSSGEDESVLDHLAFIFTRLAILGLLGAVFGGIIGVAYGQRLSGSLLGYAIGSMLGFVGGLFSVKSFSAISLPSRWTLLAFLLTLLHGILFASNSFVVWESRSLAWILISFGFIVLSASCRIENPTLRASAIYNTVMFIVCTRLAEYPKICREEQLPFCQSNFYSSPSSTLSSLPAIGVMLSVSIFLPSLVRSFLRTSASYEGSAVLWIGSGLRLLLFFSVIYWALDYAELDPRSLSTTEDIQPFKFIVSRLVIGVALVGAPLTWFRACPICIRIEMTNNQDRIKRAAQEGDYETVEKLKPVSVEIIGFANAYGSLYLLFVLCIFAALFLCNKPLGAISLALMLYQILSLFETSDALEIPQKSLLLVPTVLGMLATQYYFATGHQATLVSIQWDIAFIFTDKIVFPVTHLALIFNTFGPYILAGLSLPLTVFYKLSPSPKNLRASELIVSKVVKAVSGGMIHVALLSLINCVMTAVLRRHLMVWKIFAPRFMLAGTAMLVFELAALIGTYAAGHTVRGIFDIFG
ncbi:uncharacterized protein V1516DRAFT_692037 [Lipomyces oligophaga]|uniref:uncharacterized protein n=1 Tax=Lipomyces oligophaga TaxID=45792 RepID=UPI0034CF6FDB